MRHDAMDAVADSIVVAPEDHKSLDSGTRKSDRSRRLTRGEMENLAGNAGATKQAMIRDIREQIMKQMAQVNEGKL